MTAIKKSIFSFYVYECSPYMYVLCHVSICMIPVKVRRGSSFSWNWSYKCLLAFMWIPGIEPRSLEEQRLLLKGEPPAYTEVL